jgi:aminoglycoside phosphotransferase family enzyme/predicted kinase
MDHQRHIFKAMSAPAFYPHPVTQIEQRETHISKVFLTDRLVYKIKKPVDLGFLNYTSLEKRKHFCAAEVMLNRRLSDNVYLAVVPITYREGHYFLNGPGEPVEYAVKMRRLPDKATLNQLLQNNDVASVIIDQLSVKLAAFYQNSITNDRISKYGAWETIWSNWVENFEQAQPYAGDTIDQRQYDIIKSITLAFLKRNKNLFRKRVKAGHIRDCHGDLRCGHIYYHKGIQIIDCIEFNDRFRFADVVSDLAFIAMDLDVEGFPAVAHQLILACADHMNDPDLFVLLDFYKCYRAFVRAKVHCLSMAGHCLDQWEQGKLRRKITRFIELAYQYVLRFARPTLWVVCGLPASGKSTIANELAKSQDILVLNSDEIRKKLFGFKPANTHVRDIEKGIYSQRASALTYGKMLLRAQEELKQKRSVILDATFSQKNQRTEVLRLAQDHDVNVLFIECKAPRKYLERRLKKREQKPSISDARIKHLNYFIQNFEPLDEIGPELYIIIRTDQPVSDTLQQIYAHENYPSKRI